MRILLIDPPMQRFTGFAKYGLPLGLLSLAEAWPCDVSVWDADYNPHGESMPFTAKINRYHLYPEALETEHPIWDEIAEVITREKPDAVGVSVISPKLPSALRVAKIAKACGVPRVDSHKLPSDSLYPKDSLIQLRLLRTPVVAMYQANQTGQYAQVRATTL